MTDDYAQHVSVTDGLDIMAKKKNRVGGSFLFKVDDKKASLILLQHMVTKENLSIAFGAMVNILKHLE
ncbi:hypothetical protein COZ60_01270 [Candidatus Bathyarchaeota archaeon CG_4_8_14_3_um_filter_42_8]|nr:MAG: hypothetical protein COZ60_01270 [Candidatus Bathyarchaeota archaeon CG_4_8_14_3_um_filter_42_8]